MTLALTSNSRESRFNSGIQGHDNTRPMKKAKIELPLPIAASPLAHFHPFSDNITRISLTPMVPQPKVLPSLAPRIPAPVKSSTSSQGPKINGITMEHDNQKLQKNPATGKGVPPVLSPRNKTAVVRADNCRHKQFWKAGDYDGPPCGDDWESYAGGSDHIRVHPRFLHSNATSHKWVLGAFAELLDNSLDEVLTGATFVNVDMMRNQKSGDKMLVIEDNGGGMDPIKMRQCMSLGYSAKSKIANTIGQYGNGFKTSTMRLGADVIVFSRFRDKNGRRFTQSIGLLSYSFLRFTKKEDIEVPILDYEGKGQVWNKIIGSTSSVIEWNKKVDTIVQWSPFSSESNLLEQFNHIKDHGTRIFIYNLWEDDQGELELDFDTDPHDIQIRGVNKDEKTIQMAQQYPNSKHFLTYRYSLRSYASMLYLRFPPDFRIILRGKDVEQHNIVNDMMMTQQLTYRPQHSLDGAPRESNMVAMVTIGFVKDAKAHIDVQGFNVYHKNRLIKPFWRVWHPPGSDGRGVIGVLEADFVEPAHDKQGFERTLILSRLEAKLAQMQKSYWSKNCHEIGYAPRQMKKRNKDKDQPSHAPTSEKPTGLDVVASILENKYFPSQSMHKSQSGHMEKQNVESSTTGNVEVELSNNNNHHENAYSSKSLPSKKAHRENSSQTFDPSSYKLSRSIINVEKSNIDNNSGNLHSPKSLLSSKGLPEENRSQTVSSSPLRMSKSYHDRPSNVSDDHGNMHSHKSLPFKELLEKYSLQIVHSSPHRSPTLVENNSGEPTGIKANLESKSDDIGHGFSHSMEELIKENQALRERLKMKEKEFLGDFLEDLDEERNKRKLLEADLDQERNKRNILEAQLQEAKRKTEEEIKEKDNLITIFLDERKRREVEEENLRKKLKDALNTIEELYNRV